MTTAEIIMDLVDSYGQAMREYTKKPTYGNQAPVGDAWEAIKAQVEKLHTEVSPVYMAVRRAIADHEAEKAQAIVEASNPAIYGELKHALFGPTAIEPSVAVKEGWRVQCQSNPHTHLLECDRCTPKMINGVVYHSMSCPNALSPPVPDEVYVDSQPHLKRAAGNPYPDATVTFVDRDNSYEVTYTVEDYEASNTVSLAIFQACYRRKQPANI